MPHSISIAAPRKADRTPVPKQLESESSDDDEPSGPLSYSASSSDDTVPSTVIPFERVELIYPDRILCLGASESGKTTLIRNIIRRYISSGRTIAPDGRCVFWFGANAHQESSWLPKSHQCDHVSKKKLTAIREMMRKGFAGRYVVIVLDDVLGETFHNDKFYADFISTCRHDRVILVIGLQYLRSVPPVIRENVKRFFVCSINNQTKKSLYELSSNPNQYDFFGRLSELQKGEPVLIDVRPGVKQECTRVAVPKLERL